MNAALAEPLDAAPWASPAGAFGSPVPPTLALRRAATTVSVAPDAAADVLGTPAGALALGAREAGAPLADLGAAATPGDVDGELAGLHRQLRAGGSDLDRLSRAYQEAALPNNTRRSYLSRFAVFVSWCAARGVPAIPVPPEVLRLYLVALADEKKSVPTISLSLAAINKAHQVLGHAPPGSEEVRATVRELRRMADQPEGLRLATLKRIVTACADDPLATRDRAILLVTYFALLPRAKSAGLDREGVQRKTNGYLVRVTNGDQEGAPVGLPIQSDLDVCPVHALDDWLVQFHELALRVNRSPACGPLFVALRPGGRGHPLIMGQRISPKDVDRILKRRASAAGIDAKSVSANDLRAGAFAEAARRGAPLDALHAHARHRCVRTTHRYVRSVDALGPGNPIRGLT
jgi:site-specific recombinase XerD